MRLRWSDASRADLARIWEYNSDRSTARARRVEDRPLARAMSLLVNPGQGRPSRDGATRELSVPDIQYVLVYEIDDLGVSIVRVWSNAESRA